ncbi:MAG TPA: hypothetical protein VEU33_26310, partial [Archangium sp.]|nr:hypothetical protein [Archangium sp.]
MAKAHLFSDNFNDNIWDTVKWNSFGQIQEVNQRVEIRPLPGRSNVSFSGYSSKVTHELIGSSIEVEVVQVLNQVNGTWTLVSAGPDDGNRVLIAAGIGQIRCVEMVGGAELLRASCAYDPVAHRWWRLRENLGTTWWEVSPDGQRWTALFSKANPAGINLAACQLVLAAGTFLPIPNPGVAIFDSFNTPTASPSRRVEERRLGALGTREKAATLAASRPHPEHANNNDEVNYPDRPFIGNHSKSLRHDALGDPEPISYGTLLRALQSEDPGDFEEIILAPPPATGQGPVKLTNPQAGLAFDLEAPDAQAVTMPPAPRFDSEQTAAEMGERYWMALARDVPVINYTTEAGTVG